MSNLDEVGWPDPAWQETNGAVVQEVSKVRAAQEVVPAAAYEDDPTGARNQE